MEELIKAYDEYINVLSDEIDSMTIIAYIHHWKSSEERVKKGVELREKIKNLKENISFNNDYMLGYNNGYVEGLKNTIDLLNERIKGNLESRNDYTEGFQNGYLEGLNER